VNTKTDYIIVGQGLAGSVLAHTLLQHNKSVVIIDDPSLSNASKVAAGLYNPVVFKRLVKSWMADELLTFMDEFYPAIERSLQEKFYFQKQIVKPFAEEQEKVLWLKKKEEAVGKYLSEIRSENFLKDIIYNPLGAAEIINAGNIDTNVFLSSSRNYFSANAQLIEEKFDLNYLIASENNVHYKELTAGKIIFCEGYKSNQNNYFSWLPFKLTKGEILTVRIPLLFEQNLQSKVINKGVFILPIGSGIYKVGATYEWEDLTDQPTEKGKAYLISQLQKAIKVPFDIIHHQAGIRPTVSDRRPLIGLHPKYPSIGIFNGLGTKGVMLAPYFAKQFVDFLENGGTLHKEVDIARFKLPAIIQ
jgi:glycine/D-amino acid oxidase-like deaminating enzyme